MLSTIAIIADITGILSFILSILLLIKSEALRKSIIHQKIEYNKKHDNIYLKLKTFNDALQEDDPISPKYISEIRQELHTCLISYQYILHFKDRHAINTIIKKLNKPKENWDKEKICSLLDYIIARFKTKEDS